MDESCCDELRFRTDRHVNGSVRPINPFTIALGAETALFEQEPNDSISQAQLLSLPVPINGRIDEGKSRGGNPDED